MPGVCAVELLIALVVMAFAFGAAFGIFVVARHYELEQEQAYLAGHVDGYNKAVADSGEVPPWV